MAETDSEFVGHESCPKCGSSDAMSRYTDGHGYCFSCDYWEPPEGDFKPSEAPAMTKEWTPLEGSYRPLKARGIFQETCEKYGYQIGKSSKGETVHIMNIRDASKKLIAQKCRTKDKEFFVKGNLKNDVLIGMHLFSGGRKIIISEGELDMLSWSQAQGNKWPVVSLPNGAQSAAKVIGNCMEYLDNFEEIILAFDQDEPGQKAAEAAAIHLMHKNVKIMKHDLKDGNDLLKAGRQPEMINAIWNAVPYKPSTLVTIEDVWKDVLKPVRIGLPWFDERITALTYGRRAGEKYYFGAGAGIGKTDFFMRQLEFDTRVLNKKAAVFMFETPVVEIFKRAAGVFYGKPFHKPNIDWKGQPIPGSWEVSELETAVNKLRANPNIIVWNAFGCTDWDDLKPAIAYLIAAGVELFYLDHLTALATGGDKNEKEELERINAELAEICDRHGSIFHVVSHLVAPERGKTHAEGGMVLPRQFKGSRSIEFWANYMFGLERDKFHEDPEERKVTTLRFVKDRYTGEADGATVLFKFDVDTFRLNPHFKESSEPENPFEGDPSF